MFMFIGSFGDRKGSFHILTQVIKMNVIQVLCPLHVVPKVKQELEEPNSYFQQYGKGNLFTQDVQKYWQHWPD